MADPPSSPGAGQDMVILVGPSSAVDTWPQVNCSGGSAGLVMASSVRGLPYNWLPLL